MTNKIEPMNYPDERKVPSKTLKVWIANAKTPEEARTLRSYMGRKPIRHRQMGTGTKSRNK